MADYYFEDLEGPKFGLRLGVRFFLKVKFESIFYLKLYRHLTAILPDYNFKK